VLINNGSHDSVGGQPTVGYDIDIPGIAIACGYRQALTATTANEVKEQIARLRRDEGPVLLEVKVNKGARDDLGRPKSSPLENRDVLMRRFGL
jgi:phosphonopyruvate decarboxylase